MENGMQEAKPVSGKGMKNFFKSPIEKIKKFDKEMSDCKSFSFPIDLGMKITYNISKFIFKICFVLFMLQVTLWTIENFSGDYKKILNSSLNGIENSIQENKYLEFLEKLRKANNNLKINYNIQDFSKLGFLLQMEEMRKINALSSEKGMLSEKCSEEKIIKISETVTCKRK